MTLLRVGFTGTAHGTATGHGMTGAQRSAVARMFAGLTPFELHHGDCRGSDRDAHLLARAAAATCARVVGHPPINPGLRAYCTFDEILPPLPFLERDRAIVDDTELLIATPKQEPFREEHRSGTWYTVRYARSRGRAVVIVWATGLVTVEDPS